MTKKWSLLGNLGFYRMERGGVIIPQFSTVRKGILSSVTPQGPSCAILLHENKGK